MNIIENPVKAARQTVTDLLSPSVDRFGLHPLYDKIRVRSKDLAARLMFFKYGERKDAKVEHNLLTEVSSHLLILDDEVVVADRLEEIAEKVYGFEESFFDLTRYYPDQLEEIKEETMEMIKSVPDYSKETVINRIFYALIYVSKRAVVMPIAT